jgi:hypothetical protein
VLVYYRERSIDFLTVNQGYLRALDSLIPEGKKKGHDRHNNLPNLLLLDLQLLQPDFTSMRRFVSIALLGAASVSAQAGPWAQCGGSSYTGPTSCVSGWTCVELNEWFSHCKPGEEEKKKHDAYSLPMGRD